MGVNIIKLKDAFKKRIAQKPFMFSLIAFMIGTSIFAYGLTRASSSGCNDNSIVRCGAYSGASASMETLKSRMNNNEYSIYSKALDRNISATDLTEANFKRGYVSDENKVYVYADQSKWWDSNNTLVAKDAYSFGRQSIGDSSEVVAADGTKFYVRNPSVSYGDGTGGLKSWIKLDSQGRFEYAIILDCGNPVIGTPTTTPTPPPTPTPTPTTPNLSIKKYVGGVTTQSNLGYLDADKDIASQPKLKVKPGETITYKIDLRNTGNGAATGVTIADQVETTIGAAVDINTLTITAQNVPGARIETVNGKKWIKSNAFTINPGESKYIEFRVRVKANFTGSFDNIACYATTGMTIPVCNDAQVIVDPPTPTPTTPNLSIKKYVGGVTTQSNLGYLDADKDIASQPKLKVKPGETITYKIDLRNTGNGAATGVTIADQVETTIGAAVDINTLTITAQNVPGARIETVNGKKWIKSNAFTINPGESKYIEFRVRVKANFTGSFDNIACYATTGMTIPVCNDAQVIVDPPTPTPTTPNLSIKKYVGGVTTQSNLGYLDADKDIASQPKLKVKPGETITYKIDLRNTGNGAATGVTIADQVETTIGAAVDINTLTITAQNVPGARIETVNGKKWIKSNAFTINPGESKYIEFRVRVKANFTGSFDNIACYATTGMTIPVCNDAQVIVDPPFTVPVYKCTNLTFEELTRTSFKFTVTGEARNGATITGYVIKVDGREVYNGTANNFTYNQTTPGTYTVKAYVKTNKGTTAEVAVCTKTITVKPAPEIPTYTIKKYVNTQDAQDENGAVTVGPNVPFEYKIVVKNTSDTATINSIKAWDVLPAGVEYVDNTLKLNGVAVANDSDYFNSAKGVEITNLAAGREAIFTFQAIIKAETDEKKAEMCANVSGGTFYNNVAKADPKAQGTGEAASDLPEKQDPAVIKCTFIARPNYTIKKYVNTRDAQDENSAVTVGPNVPFEYKIEVTNTGNVDLKNVKVWDVLPSEGITVQYIDGTLKQDGNLLTQDDNFFNSSVGVTVNTLAKNQTITFTFMAKVVMNMESPGSIEGTPCTPNGTFYNNVAKADPESAAGASANDPNLGPKEDPAVIKCTFTPPVKNPSVIIDKEVSDYQVTVGGQFTWFVTVTNNGDVDLKNVVVSDQAPANTEFLKAAELAGTTIQIDSKSFKATISELKVGQKVTFAITAKLVNYQGSDITNTACVNAPEVNPTKPSENDDCDEAKIKPVKEKCTVPGMENKDKDDPTCKPKCSVKGKENLYADDKNCKDPDCIEVGGKIISTKGKGGCENPTAITAPSVTPNTGMQIIAASASTLGLSAAAFMATSRFQKRKK